jgi:amino acid adenylation domain-containing protein
MRVERFLEQSARRFPEKVALIAGKERVTYAELNRRAEAFAESFREGGVRRGDRVGLFLPNSVEIVAGFFGALKAGAVVSPIHPTTKAEKLAFILSDCQARAVVTQKRLLPEAERAVAQAPSVKMLHVVDGNTDVRCQRPDVSRTDDRSSLTSVICHLSSAFPGIDADLALLIYTSGTTGFPKGVMTTHQNIDAVSTSIATYLENTSDDIIMNVLPMSFGYGLYQVIVAVKTGGTVILESSFAFPYVILQKMKEERVTGFPLVPTIAAILLQMKELEPGALPHLRYFTNAAAALPMPHIARLRELFPTARFYSMYGQTECTRVCYLPPEQLDIRPGSVGIPIPETEAYVVDECGDRVGPGEVGELVVRGAHVMKGYWADQERTKQKLRPGPFPWERVLYTGDLFRTDDEGYLYFVARKDDIIKSRGEKVAPKEIEDVLYALDGIQQAAVVGTPDPVLGMAIKAVIVLADGSGLTEKEILRHCAAHLEDLMVPKQIEFRMELPKTDSGKIRRTVVQEEELRKHGMAPGISDPSTHAKRGCPTTSNEVLPAAELVGASR